MTQDPSRDDDATLRPRGSPALSTIVQALADDETRPHISVGDLVAAMGDRAFGPLLFIFAAPNLLPSPPGTSAILGVPLVFLSLQVLFGRTAWLPGFVMRRQMARADFGAIVGRMQPWLKRAEALLRPRLVALARPPGEKIAGAVVLFLSILIALPIPLANVAPAFAVSIIALGILGRDGLWVLAGFLIAAASVAAVGGVYFAAIKAALGFLAGLGGA